jgi:sugar-specific transcriptional regulator TrmB
MSEPVSVLQQLGFTEYKARANVALLQRSPLNGYELAKESGLPRANIYTVLQRLEERGAVVRQDTPSRARYRAVAPRELTGRIGGQIQANLARAEQALGELASPPEDRNVWNMRDYPALVEHARTLVNAAQIQLLVAISPEEAHALADFFVAAQVREVRLVTLCTAACPSECGSCRGQIYKYRVTPEQRSRWLMVVADAAEIVAGEIDDTAATRAIRTTQPLLVHLVTWYIRHSIALAAVLTDLGEQLTDLLQPETQAILRPAEFGEDTPG